MKKLLYALAAALLLFAGPAGALPPVEHHTFCVSQGTTAGVVASVNYYEDCSEDLCEELTGAVRLVCLDACAVGGDAYGLVVANAFYNMCMGSPHDYCSATSPFC